MLNFVRFAVRSATLDGFVAAQVGFEHGSLSYWKYMGFKASRVTLSGMLCSFRPLNRSTGCCAVAGLRPQHIRSK